MNLKFNQSLSDWDVSSVVSMYSTFSEAESFDGEVGSWNVSRVVDMNSMFWSCPAFNQPVGDWVSLFSTVW